MYAKILVPLDGSPCSDRAFEEAVALARVMKSRLLLLHVIDTLPLAMDMVPPASWQDLAEGLRKHGQGLLERAHQTAATHGIASETRLIEDRSESVADSIVAEAAGSACDLVVMGTHGRRGFARALAGSDAERVLRLCPVPVLLVRHPGADKG